jgi:hypothetical protein
MPCRTAETDPSPDLVIAFDADERTADAARYCVRTIALPAAAARARAEQLTGALLARTCPPRRPRHSAPVELRVWRCREGARVELAGSAEALGAGEPVQLLERLADRWGVEHDERGEARVWFEVDGADVGEPLGAPALGLAAQPT